MLINVNKLLGRNKALKAKKQELYPMSEIIIYKTKDGHDKNAVVRKFRITTSDGKSYKTKHYNLYDPISFSNAINKL